jgi:hypothetical protein
MASRRVLGPGAARAAVAVLALALSQAGGSLDTVLAETVPPCMLHTMGAPAASTAVRWDDGTATIPVSMLHTITVPLAGDAAHRQPALLGLTALAPQADRGGAGTPAGVVGGGDGTAPLPLSMLHTVVARPSSVPARGDGGTASIPLSMLYTIVK